MPVGGDGDVEQLAIESAERRDIANEIDDPVTQERLAAGKPDFFYPEAHHDSDHAQVVGERKLGVLRTLVARAAIHASVVTPVRNADPEISDEAPVFVAEPHKRSCFEDEQGRNARNSDDESRCVVALWFLSKYGRPRRFLLNPCPCYSKEPPRRAGMPEATTWSEPGDIIVPGIPGWAKKAGIAPGPSPQASFQNVKRAPNCRMRGA